MIHFVTKRTLAIDKNRLCFEEGQKLYDRIENLFRENACEIILIYEGNTYCGYIESSDMTDVVMPEYYLGFDPMELGASDNLMEELKERIRAVQKEILIPVKDSGEGTVRVFASDSYVDNDFSQYLARYAQLDDPYFLLEAYADKNVVMLPELDEFTYLCYKILQQKGQSCHVEGKCWKYIHVDQTAECRKENAAAWEYNYMDIITLLERMVKLKVSEELKRIDAGGIKTYKVIIPDYEELTVHGEFEEKRRREIGISIENLKKKEIPDRQFWINRFMQTECCDSEEELLDSLHPEQYGKEERTIYLAGPCIAAGVTSTETASIACMLYQKLAGQDLKYNVKRIVRQKQDISLVEELRKLDLKESDIIIYITDSHAYQKECNDLDLLEDYNNRPTDSWWFLDCPVHSLRGGNEMIVNKLYPLIWQEYKRGTAKDRWIRPGRPVLSGHQKAELQKYIDSAGFHKRDNLQVGCIVMNANPFTRGHLYLVEWAAGKVDELLVFVVEEDLSEFSFPDRLEMVKRGVAHMAHVRVIPSGRFILSEYTFVSYFEKDRRQDEKIDAATDIRFFGTYIAPAFGINKRFVGEEPKDLVTRQYNEEMKEKLPLYGIEVEEIPRQRIRGRLISATEVRRLYRIKDWGALKDFLPDSTMRYLRQHMVAMREKKNLSVQRDVPVCLTRGLNKILSEYGKVVFYGIGTDGQGLYRLVDSQDKDRIVLCDKRADTESLTAEDKQVYGPSALKKEFHSFPVIITSTRFGGEIFDELVQMGICQSRIIRNLYSFYAG